MASGGPIATSAQYEAALQDSSKKVNLTRHLANEFSLIGYLAREGAEQREGRLLVAAANIL